MQNDSNQTKRGPSIAMYAALIGVLALAGILAVIYGKHAENPSPTPVSSGVASAPP